MSDDNKIQKLAYLRKAGQTPDADIKMPRKIRLRRKGGMCMKGGYTWHKDRYLVWIYWEGKQHQFYRYSGEPIWHKKTAERFLEHIRAEIDAECFNPAVYKKKNPVAFSQYYERWVSLIDVADRTKSGYSDVFRLYLQPFFKDKNINHIRRSDILELQKQMKERGLSKKTIYNTLTALRTCLRWGEKNEELHKAPSFPPLTNPRRDTIHFLTYEEQLLVLSKIEGEHRHVIEFGMEYGLRPQEAVVLEWKDVDFEKKQISFRRRWVPGPGYQVLEGTKTVPSRGPFHLTENAISILKKLRTTGTEYIFIGRRGKPFTPKSIYNVWMEARNKTGFPDVTLYEAMKHSWGCQSLERGHSIDEVADIFGHTDTYTTRLYAKRSPAATRDILEGRTKAKVILFSNSLPIEKKDD